MKQKLHLALNKNDYVDVFRYAYLTKSDLVISNGHLLVWHKTEEIFPDSFIKSIPDGEWLIPYMALMWMNKRKAVYSIREGNILEVIAENVTTIHKLVPNDETITDRPYPDFRSLFNNEYDYNTELNHIGVKPEFLLKVKNAIDPYGMNVVLYFENLTKQMKVKVTGSDLQRYKAIIMPVIADEDL